MAITCDLCGGTIEMKTGGNYGFDRKKKKSIKRT